MIRWGWWWWCRRTNRSLIGKTHRHYLPSQRHNHQWNMVINNLSDVDVKPENYHYHRTSTTCSGSSVAKTKDRTGTVHSDDNEWSAAGRRLLAADDTSIASPVSTAYTVLEEQDCHNLIDKNEVLVSRLDSRTLRPVSVLGLLVFSNKRERY